jgi:DNA invertase Pin-like site-specific DNA recombinase
MTNAAIYTRLSQDRDDDKTGTARQETDCRALCKREGLTITKVYRDDDRSAYSGKPRPDFNQMLADLDHYDALVYWKTDRLVRRTAEFWKVMGACDEAGVRLVSVVDPIDSSTPIGRGVASLLASVGEQESHNIGTRVKSKGAENAKAGRYHGGRRAFGYEKDGVTIKADEAVAIRDARDRIFRGESMASICTDWNRRGVEPTSAKAWRVTRLKETLTRPRLAGLVTYQGEVVVGVEARWPAIISVEDHERLVQILIEGAARKRGRPAKHLLTGLIRCGRCGAVMRSGVRSVGDRRWSCTNPPGDESHCGRVTVKAEPVDELVEEAILYRLDSAKFRRARASATKRAAKTKDAPVVSIAELEAKLVQLGTDLDEGLISRREWLARRGPLLERLDAARAALVPDAAEGALAQFDGADDVRAVWDGLTIDAKRVVARALFTAVIVKPKVPGAAPKFDPERIDIDWIV